MERSRLSMLGSAGALNDHLDMKTPALLAKLSKLWEAKRPTIRRNLRPPATESSSLAFEKFLGRALPEPLKSFYNWHDGFRDEHAALEEFFGWCSQSSVKKHKRLLDKMEQEGHFEDWQKGSWWNSGWLPFLQFNNEDFVCVDLDGSLLDLPGAVFIRRNGEERRTVLAPSFAAWLSAHVAITEAGPDTDDEDSWVDHFLSRKTKNLRSQISSGFPKHVSAIPAKKPKSAPANRNRQRTSGKP